MPSASFRLVPPVCKPITSIALSADNRHLAVAQFSAPKPNATLSLFDVSAPKRKPLVLQKTAPDEYGEGVYNAVWATKFLHGTLFWMADNDTDGFTCYCADLGNIQPEVLFTSARAAGPLEALFTNSPFMLVPAPRPFLYDLEQRQTVAAVTIPKGYRAVCDNLSQVMLIAREGAKAVQRFDFTTEKLVQKYALPTHSEGVFRALCAAGHYVALDDTSNKSLIIWNKSSGKRLAVPPDMGGRAGLSHNFCVALSHNEERVAVGCTNGRVMGADISSGQLLQDEVIHPNNRVSHLHFSPDDSLLISATLGEVCLTPATSGLSG